METAVLALGPVVEALKSRWALEIFSVLQVGPLRYAQLWTELEHRHADGRVYDKTMQVALHHLIDHRLVERRAEDSTVRYAVTSYGRALAEWAVQIPPR